MILAVFDVDHTLVPGSSGGEFLKFLWKKRKLPWKNAYYLVKGVRRYRKGKLDEKGFVELGALTCFGLREGELRDLGKLCVAERMRFQIYHEARAAIARHLAEGHRVILASGSPCFIVEPLAEHLGIQAGIGSIPIVRDGICTRETVQPIPFREGKRDLVLAWSNGLGIDLPRSWCYSDREIDLPLMEIVGNPVAVNPKPSLLAHAREKGWRVEQWSRTGPGAAER